MKSCHLLQRVSAPESEIQKPTPPNKRASWIFSSFSCASDADVEGSFFVQAVLTSTSKQRRCILPLSTISCRRLMVSNGWYSPLTVVIKIHSYCQVTEIFHQHKSIEFQLNIILRIIINNVKYCFRFEGFDQRDTALMRSQQ